MAYRKTVHRGCIGIESHHYTSTHPPTYDTFVRIVKTLFHQIDAVSVTFSTLSQTLTFSRLDLTTTPIPKHVFRNTFVMNITHVVGRCDVQGDYYETMKLGHASTRCRCLAMCFHHFTGQWIPDDRLDHLEKTTGIHVDVVLDQRHLTFSRRNTITEDRDVLIHGDGSSEYKILFKNGHYDVITKRYNAKDCHCPITGLFVGYKKHHPDILPDLKRRYRASPPRPRHYFIYRKTMFDRELEICDDAFKTQRFDDPRALSEVLVAPAILVGHLDTQFILEMVDRYEFPLSDVRFDRQGRIVHARIGAYRFRTPLMKEDVDSAEDLARRYHATVSTLEQHTHRHIEEFDTLADIAYSLFDDTIHHPLIGKAFLRSDTLLQHRDRLVACRYPIGDPVETDHYVPGKLGIYLVGAQVLCSVDLHDSTNARGIYWESSDTVFASIDPMLIDALFDRLTPVDKEIVVCRRASEVEAFFSRTKKNTQRLTRISDTMYMAEGSLEHVPVSVYGVFLHAYARSF